MKKRMKSSKDKVLFGVCSEIAECFAISLFMVRLLFVLTPSFIIVYFILNWVLHKNPPLY
ncbi:MAG: PspC domain-containing protein [Bacillus sp. (in: firmicutes)]